jgi:hypothetical protein
VSLSRPSFGISIFEPSNGDSVDFLTRSLRSTNLLQKGDVLRRPDCYQFSLTRKRLQEDFHTSRASPESKVA